MTYLDICSGISAPTVAWQPLGWKAMGYAEIEKFPSRVLAHHYPDTPNYGDITQFRHWPDGSPDVLIGGTPCQSFSVAGLRKGLRDPRGQLMLTFVEIAARYRPSWVIWENVPGCLSSEQGEDFASLLGALTGRRVEVPNGGWQNSGICQGHSAAYGVAWRTLDAQFFGVPQRRRRVFVVGYLGDWRRAAAVLFDIESVRGNSPPRRKTREGTAEASGSRSQVGCREVARTLRAQSQLANLEDQDTLIPQVAAPLVARDTKGADSDTKAGHLITAIDTTQITSAANRSNPQPGDPCHPLASGAHAPAIAYRTTGNDGVYESGQKVDCLNTSTDPNQNVILQNSVRRLTPVECERLQGFPDHYTMIPGQYRQRDLENYNEEVGRLIDLGIDYYEAITLADHPDGPRYKALGNSMAVPNIKWLGQRIELVSEI